jgi:hypothetical protein|tara:strand:- start:607 stop:810 length:204 start_codon:yes stop_codon:yes gene_type:complete
MKKSNKKNKPKKEEYDVCFEPDDLMIMAINEVNDLRSLVEQQGSVIDSLKNDLLLLKKKRHGKRLQD